MNKILQWLNVQTPLDLSELENQLTSTLTPVIPRSRFVEDLKRQLLTGQGRPSFGSRRDFSQVLLLGLAGIISGTILLLTGIRAVITLLAALGAIHQVSQQLKEGKSPARVQVTH